MGGARPHAFGHELAPIGSARTMGDQQIRSFPGDGSDGAVTSVDEREVGPAHPSLQGIAGDCMEESPVHAILAEGRGEPPPASVLHIRATSSNRRFSDGWACGGLLIGTLTTSGLVRQHRRRQRPPQRKQSRRRTPASQVWAAHGCCYVAGRGAARGHPAYRRSCILSLQAWFGPPIELRLPGLPGSCVSSPTAGYRLEVPGTFRRHGDSLAAVAKAAPKSRRR